MNDRKPETGNPKPTITCFRLSILFVTALAALPACGGGGTGTPPPSLETLAYVETQCSGTANLFVEHQALRLRQGDREPVTVFETPAVSVPGKGYLCPSSFHGYRLGGVSVTREAFQSVAVSPDGASVAFEVSDEFSVNPRLPLNLPPQQKGIFWVRADGTGLRLLGPPSREPFFYVAPGPFTYVFLGLSFSPNGGTIVFADRGPDADGHEAAQVVTVDVATGTRTQVTRLPPAVPPPNYPLDAPTVYAPRFVDERTISFYASANPDGLNPEGIYLLMTTKTDGSGLEVPLPIAVPLPGGQVELRFVITGDNPQAINAVLPGEPTNNPPLGGFPQQIVEVFVIDEARNALQLTNFRRVDTFGGGVDLDREHVYFVASADPLGTNPSESCQLFSIDRLGSDLRQLTTFRETEHSIAGCSFKALPNGCGLYLSSQDPRSGTLVFYSDCDPLGTNPNGGQIFAMQPDGSGLRQLTDAQGLVHEAPGAYSGDIPGPWAYGPWAYAPYVP